MKSVPILSKSTYDYVPFEDRELPVAEQTVFELKVLTPSDDTILENLMGNVTRTGAIEMRNGDQNYAALTIGLIGVRNFFDEEGKPIQVVRNQLVKVYGNVNPINDDFLARIPKSVRTELAAQIQLGKEIDEEDSKNS